MWIYRKINDNEFLVGFMEIATDATGTYSALVEIENYPTKEEARKAVNYLNGGNPVVKTESIDPQ